MLWVFIYYRNLILLVALISLALFSVSIHDLERKAVCGEGSHFHVEANKIGLIRKFSFDYKTRNMRDAWTSLGADSSNKLCPPPWASPLHWELIPQVWSANNYERVAYLSYSLLHRDILKTQTHFFKVQWQKTKGRIDLMWHFLDSWDFRLKRTFLIYLGQFCHLTVEESEGLKVKCFV